MDEPLAFESYGGTTAAGSGTAHEVFADSIGSVTKVVEAATGTIAADYTYDALHRRVAKTVDGVTTAFVYDVDADQSLDVDV